MAKKKAEKNIVKASGFFDIFKSETFQFIIGLTFLLCSVYMILAFTSFFFTGGSDMSILEHPIGDDLGMHNNIRNYAGAQGARVANFFINDSFGVPSYFIPFFLIILGLRMMRTYRLKLWKWFIGCSVLMVWSSILLAYLFTNKLDFIFPNFIYPGGQHGANICTWCISQIGEPGLILSLFIIAVLFCIYISSETIHLIRKALHPSINFKKNKEEEAEAAGIQEDIIASDPLTKEKHIDPQPVTVDFPQDEPNDDKIDPEEDIISGETEDEPDISEDEYPEGEDNDDKNLIIEKEETQKTEPKFSVDKAPDDIYEGPELEPYNPKLDLENYHFPPLGLLQKYENSEPIVDMEEQSANKDKIINVLRSFGIEISTIKATVGPTITLYEITPAEGIRISKIRNLEDDIALSLKALGIRIIAPIPGKGTIGIEVPNKKANIVSMESILNSKKFQENSYELPLALGKTITNEVFMVDLTKAPHMLVAGATGMGKSVGLNAVVTSLLYKKHPAELKFVIIDPKKVEFGIYAPIERHYLAKLPDSNDAIITDVTKVVQTLKSLCVEMDTRYDLLKKAGARNIKEYNEKFIKRRLNPQNGHKFLPYIVVIIDEFGDLIMTAGKEVELPICRIAQLARAVGIHMIIATQRPTTSIITGTIKANFPARVAFRVASMIDSRIILDRPGANQLIGKGDMLYLQGGEPIRIQCAFIDTPEVDRIVNFISKQQGYTSAFMLPEYVEEGDGNATQSDIDMNRLDSMFEDAARLVVIHQQGSTSLIQRKFSIGYNRAGRIMDQLEKAGIVGPTEGSKARKVLCADETELEMRLSGLQS